MYTPKHPVRLTTALLFAAGLAAACSDRVPTAPPMVAPAASASDTTGQTSVVGTVPAAPTSDTQATPSATESDLSKAQESNSMPLPGQANDHSTTAPNASQKADTTKP